MIYLLLVLAFFEYRIVNSHGFYDQCVYSSVYGTHVINVQKTELCPVSIEVDDE